ncbi:MAG: hypothetical protein ABI266_00965 [Ginsengibacter sp.]
MEIQLKIIGILLIVLALIHGIFPKYFNWKTELHSLSLINRQMVYVHSFFIALTVLLMGFLCFSSACEMINTNLGKRISFGLAIFWFVRLVIQLFGYSPALWKGKKLETCIHIVFCFFWMYLTLVFSSVWLA